MYTLTERDRPRCLLCDAKLSDGDAQISYDAKGGIEGYVCLDNATCEHRKEDRDELHSYMAHEAQALARFREAVEEDVPSDAGPTYLNRNTT